MCQVAFSNAYLLVVACARASPGRGSRCWEDVPGVGAVFVDGMVEADVTGVVVFVMESASRVVGTS